MSLTKVTSSMLAAMAQGNKNYISSGSFENNSTSGWSLGTATLTSAFPSGAPTFGSGASGNLSIAATSSGKLAGSYSLSLASSAATTAGNFLASDALTLDIEDQAKVLGFRFYYSVTVNGLTSAGMSGTSSNNYGVAIYDITNSTWIQPAGVYNLVQSSGVGIAQGTFQTPSNMTSFRVVLFNANATTGATTLLLDDFYCGPQAIAFGPAMSDWQSYTPTITAGSISNYTATGYYQRVGDSIIIKGQIVFSSTSGAFTQVNVSLPSGLSMDLTKMSGTPAGPVLGSSSCVDSTVVSIAGGMTYNGTTSLRLTTFATNTSDAGAAVDNLTSLNISNTSPFTFNTADNILWQSNPIPISGWSSNTVQSADSEQRIVAACYTGTNDTSVAASTSEVIPFKTLVVDTTSSYSTSTGIYTCPIAGVYKIGVVLALNDGGGNVSRTLVIEKDSVAAFTSSQDMGTSSIGKAITVVGMVQAVAGTQIRVKYFNGYASGVATITDSIASTLSIERLSGPATVQASESVNGSYTDTSGTSVGNATGNYTYPTKIRDSHSCYSGGTLTIPVAGMYRFSATYNSGVSLTAGQASYIAIQRNGTVIGQGIIYGNGAGSLAQYQPHVNVTYPCVAGDTIVVRAQASGGTTASTSAGVNNFNWERVGN